MVWKMKKIVLVVMVLATVMLLYTSTQSYMEPTRSPTRHSRIYSVRIATPAVQEKDRGRGSTSAAPPRHSQQRRNVTAASNHKSEDLTHNTTVSQKFTHLKKILFWNDAYGDTTFDFGIGQDPFIKAKCQVNTCYATDNRTLFPLHDINALIWHLRANDKSLPDVRWPDTYYVFWMKESALYTYDDLRDYDGVFNWTFTYRMDSDIPYPSGSVRRLPSGPSTNPNRNYAAGKTKMASWFVSNCNTVSLREKLVRTLGEFLMVDIYGACGPLRCPRKDSHHCYKMIEKDYKFYLSFENSLCYEYVTEKLYNVLQYNVVPVVYGLGYATLNLPPHSYIDVFDFDSVKHLADYLLYLNSNDTAYNEYFRWKDHYEVYRGWPHRAKAFCNLCELLHQPDKEKLGTVTVLQRQRTEEERVRLGQAKRPQDVNRLKSVRSNFQESGLERNQASIYDKNSRLKYIGKHENGLQVSKESNTHKIVNELKYSLIPNKYRKIYNNLNEWFVQNQCITPYSDSKMASFIYGLDHNKLKEELQEEEKKLPWLVRPPIFT